MDLIRLIGKLLGVMVFAVISIGTFLATLVLGVITFMVMIGGGIIAIITFGVIDYRKSKKSLAPRPPDEV